MSDDAEHYPFRVELSTRFDDVDTQGHINNVAIANLYQESRVQFHREIFRELRKTEPRDEALSKVLADIHIRYTREAFYPYPVTITCGVSRLGNTSYTTRSIMLQNGQPVGSCDAVLVYVKGGKSHPIPDKARAVLQDYCLPEA